MTDAASRHSRERREAPIYQRPIYVICGLGNPGPRYARNRHNAGFQCVDHLAAAWDIALDRMRCKAHVGTGRALGLQIVLAKPMTFMNDSGLAVSAIVHWYKIPLSQLLVIYDDLDLPLGRIRLRPNGSAGGHKGMASIIAQLGSDRFPRLRIGIGRPAQGEPYDYVLSDFAPDQWLTMQETYAQARAAIECFLQRGIETAMSQFN